jgi:hypothetical protein
MLLGWPAPAEVLSPDICDHNPLNPALAGEAAGAASAVRFGCVTDDGYLGRSSPADVAVGVDE